MSDLIVDSKLSGAASKRMKDMGDGTFAEVVSVAGAVGSQGTPVVTTVSVATSSTAVLAANASRKALILSNVGANNIYVNLAGGTAVATNTLIAPNTTLNLNTYVPAGAITAIAATGATNLSVTEVS